MILYNSLQEVKDNAGDPCYFERIIQPKDLSFQIFTGTAVTALPNLEINVINISTGLVEENATAYFTVTNAADMHTITMENYSPFMCSCSKFILQITSTEPALLYYAGMFQIEDCCDSNYVVDIDGGEPNAGNSSDNPSASTVSNGYKMQCRDQALRFEAWNDCTDVFFGGFYQNGFKRVMNLTGRMYAMPKSLQKSVAWNGKVLHSETFEVFTVELWDLVPEWKLREIEDMLLLQYMTIDGEDYYFTGSDSIGSIVEELCTPMYQLKFQVQKKPKRQFYGCGDPCIVNNIVYNYVYIDPLAGQYFTEDKMPLGGDPESVIAWYAGQGFIVTETEVANVYQLEGSMTAPYFYQGGNMYKDRQFVYMGVGDATPPVVTCTKPTLSVITASSATCVVPEIGTINTTVIQPDILCEPIELTFPIVDDGGSPINPVTVYQFNELVLADIRLLTVDGQLFVDGVDYWFDAMLGEISLTASVLVGEDVYIFATRNAQYGQITF